MTEDSSIQRWGGLAGVAGSLLFVIVVAIVAVFIGPEPAGLTAAIERFPDIRTPRTIEDGLYLVVLMLWVSTALALYRRLRATRPATALFGSALNLVGLAVLAAGALPHAVWVGLADRYHAADASPAQREALALQWQAMQNLLDTVLITGLVVLATGVTVLATAVFALGRVTGVASLILGLASLGAATTVLIDPYSIAAAVSVLALIGFHLLIGAKLMSVTQQGRSR